MTMCRACLEREHGQHARDLCDRCYGRQWYAAHRPKYASAQGWRKRNPELNAISNRMSTQVWAAKNPERVAISLRAGGLVQAAIRRGELTRPSHCEQCGSGKKVTAAHSDYSRPLDVRWLCHSCHTTWDHAEPKTLASPFGMRTTTTDWRLQRA